MSVVAVAPVAGLLTLQIQGSEQVVGREATHGVLVARSTPAGGGSGLPGPVEQFIGAGIWRRNAIREPEG